MSGIEQARVRLAGWAERRRAVRRLTAVLSAYCAVVYAAIGLQLVSVSSKADLNERGIVAFGLSAGLAFALGTVVMLATDRLGPQIIGAVFQVFVIVMYVAVAPSRAPSFELWGISLKVAQTAILVSLLFLIVAPGGRCPCAYCEHHRDLHKGRCLVPGCACDVFL